jgi:hypothetical protein
VTHLEKEEKQLSLQMFSRSIWKESLPGEKQSCLSSTTGKSNAAEASKKTVARQQLSSKSKDVSRKNQSFNLLKKKKNLLSYKWMMTAQLKSA